MNDRELCTLVELDHVTVAYGQHIALEDVTFGVCAGEFLGVIGPNGSGKTTLLRVILGLVKPISGQVRVFGQPRNGMGNDQHRLSYVPQLTDIDRRFPIRVLDVVLMGRYGKIGLGRRPSKEDRAKAMHALEQVGMADLARRQIGQLSGGQQQRVLVARALALEPELLLLDEPTTGMDPTTTNSLYELLHHLNHSLGLTIVMVSHDVSVVSRYATYIACLNRRLVVHDVPSRIMTHETLESIYGHDAMWFLHGDVPHLVVPTDEGCKVCEERAAGDV